ncbi:hypothetical protein Ahy_B09g098023 [Arachis hypogaea]|uniref:DUF4283 domain-containing protein n=1 Tax=Arachis hypogaea TaxID=3818 RepID=A0A444XQH5_ARAHY|nr:hypothetical protein Ahy_B09g098023 [Arachis hypogaea]
MSEKATTPDKTTFQEEDLMNCSTKKVKPNGDEVLLDVEAEENGGSADVDMQHVNRSPSIDSSQEKELKVPSKFGKGVTSSKLTSNGRNRICGASYKDSLLMGGAGISLLPEEIDHMVAEDYILEEISDEGTGKAAPFDPKPEVEVSLAEYGESCRPWKLSLIVKVLGKNIGFRTMESWVQRVWSKNGNFKISSLCVMAAKVTISMRFLKARGNSTLPNALEQNHVIQEVSNLKEGAESLGVFWSWMLATKAQRRFNRSNSPVGPSTQRGNPIRLVSRFQSLEHAEQEESEMEAHIHKEGFVSNNHVAQVVKTKKSSLSKHTSYSKSRLVGPKGVSKAPEGRGTSEKGVE